MIAMRGLIACAAIALSLAAASAQQRPLRYGSTGGAYFDGRDDDRDFRSNGYFPGNFAADPFSAGFGAAGPFGSTPWHSARPYPSQVVFGAPCQDCRPQRACRHRGRRE
ncbi:MULTISPECIES: BA14K family protein [Bradyrhizobium]|uniref:BA14K family protein n=1 Tax=Bradyrhizobium elkanii TaxID=29448 RepID=A0A4U6RGV0_BRAEL|nr:MULTISPECIES: BA14K family protein [Bradyrhizobium]MTV13273.1 BA14K family protein [Bradyrhizobium sp. BR2003]TKV73444.1 BA14K family protein [Bradyrhizobium elkanii]